METGDEYFVMSGDGPLPAAVIADDPDIASDPWYSGALIVDAISSPLVYTLVADQPGHLKPLYDDLSAPLVRQDLLDTLVAAGVDNLQTFPAEILDPGSGARHTNYQAFNVVGVVSAVDKARSRVRGTGLSPEAEDADTGAAEESTIVDVDFENLALDASQARGMLLFRLAESVTAIVVHASVRRRIEASGIGGIAFHGPDE